MKHFLFTFSAIFLLAACGQTQSSVNIPVKDPGKPSPNEAIADFSEGCFWHAEIVFQSLAGVRDAVSGYAGGTDKHPDYEKVCTGTTGHAETVQVYYDPSKISYATLVDAFFASQNPTQVDGQGYDMGTEYRSIAFYRNAAEKQVIDAAIVKINNSKAYPDKVATQVIPYTIFYKAEDYHQEYVYNNPDNPYVQNVCIPELIAFKKEFKGNFKK